VYIFVGVDIVVSVYVGVEVLAGVKVGVSVNVGVKVLVGVKIGVSVNVGVKVLVGVKVGVSVNVAIAQAGAESPPLIGAIVRSYSSYILTCKTPGNCFSERVSGPTRLYSPPRVPQ
jgi:hypothetical protein